MFRKYKTLLASSVVLVGAVASVQQSNAANNVNSNVSPQPLYDWSKNPGKNCVVGGTVQDCVPLPSTGEKTPVTGVSGAVGDQNTVVGGGFAVGTGNKAGTINSSGQYLDGFAFGTANYAIGPASTAIGFGNLASNTSAIVIGTASQATGKGAIAMGRQSAASGDHAIVMGSASVASAGDSIALGRWSKAELAGSVALGMSSETGTTAPTGVGYATKTAAPTSVVSVGSSTLQRRIINVADGSEDHDAVNVAQLRTIADNTSSSLGGGANVGEGKAPAYVIQGDTYNDVGSALTRLDVSVTTVDTRVTNLTTNITNGTIGPVQRTGGDVLSLIAAGGDWNSPGTAQKLTNVAAGEVKKGSTDAINGSQLWETEQKISNNVSDRMVAYDGVKGDPKDMITLAGTSGTKITNLKAGDLSAGSSDAVNGSQLFATNGNVSTLTNNFNNLSTNITNGKIGPVQRTGGDVLSLIAAGGDWNSPGAAQKLTNVADGEIKAGSKDAVNGSQIHANQQSIVNHLGGSSKVNVDGTITGPTYNIANKNYNTVYDAFEGVDGEITNINNKITGVMSDALMWDKTEGAFSAMHDDGKGGKSKSKITYLADGSIAAGSSDAVNGSQLFATNQNVSTLTNNFNDLTTNITNGKIGPVQRTGSDILSLIAAGGDSTNPGTAQKLTNVARGDVNKQSTDAINGAQLWETEQKISNSVGGAVERAVTYDGVKGDPKDTITLAGTSGTKITNLKAGDLSAGSSDAVNGSQLFATNGNVSTLTNNFNDLTTNITNGKIGPVQRTGSDILSLIAAGGDATNPGAAQKLTNVADGEIKAGSKDAVNGSQIHANQQSIVNHLGGSSKVNVDGTITGPTYNIANKNYNTVYDAFEGVDGEITNINNKITGVVSDALMWDKTEGAFSAMHDDGKGGKSKSKITYLADGSIAAGSSDAVNGSQLFATNQNVSTLTNNFNDLTTNITNGKIGPVQRTGSDILSLIAAGGDSTNPGTAQKLTNVARGDVNKQSTDAINGAQLWETEQKITNSVGGAVERAVTYDGVKGDPKDTITLAGTSGTKITNLKAGDINSTSSDAVNGSQIFANQQSIVNNLGGSSKVNVDGTITGPTYNIAGNTYNTIYDAFEGVDGTITNITNGKIGPVQRTGSDILSLIAAGGDATNPGTAQKLTNVADGLIASKSKDAVNGGQIYGLSKSVADHLGGGASVNADGSVKNPEYYLSQIDSDGKVTQSSTPFTNVGDALDNLDVNVKNVNTRVDNIDTSIAGIKGDALMWDKTEGAFSAMHDDGTGGKSKSKITYLADGSIAAGSSDAVNGGQIYGLSKSVADHLGGGASVNADGSVKNPEYYLSQIDSDGKVTQSSTPFTNVGDALDNLDVNVKNVNTRVDNIDTSIAGIKGDALMWDKTESAFSAMHDDGTGTKVKSKITNLADGLIDAGSSDAVNGGQIAANNQQIAAYFGAGAGFNGGAWTGPNFQYQTVDSNGRIQNGQANNVGDALADLGTGVANVNNRVDNIENTVNNLDQDALKYNKATGSYDASRGGKDTKITGVENGTIAQNSKDAVNGGQLWDTNQRVGDLETKTGQLADGAVMYDKDSSGNKMNSVTLQGGDPSAPVSLKNVADGKIETGSKDAVNGGQLHDYTQEQMNIVYDNSKKYTDQRVQNVVQEANNYTDMKFSQLNNGVHEAKKEARQAAAIGLAAASLRYDDNPGKFSVAFGSGFWKNEGAFALGAGYTSEDGKFRTNLTGTMAGQGFGVGAGLSITLN